ncbi:hypothetical protein [Streptomyces sp. NPDC093223]|uniref:hypothetical protein n=1 Tax=Streptomyces sp. NPDC093223 TaxID=3366033 RepID=UPI0037F14064
MTWATVAATAPPAANTINSKEITVGFLKDRLAEAKDAVGDGQTERAAEIVVQALLEGPGSFTENLREMSTPDSDA